MAGTSGDGVDAACVRIHGTGESMQVHFVAHFHRPFPRSLRKRLLAAMAPSETTMEEVTRLHAALGDAFARVAVESIAALPQHHRPSAIGLAGQTVCHLPGNRSGRTATLQLGDPARVAAATGLPTVADFRQSDVAAGGQGAPLVPWTDWILFGGSSTPRVVQNIGGIGNLTWLPTNARSCDVIGFDTGPGNMIIDGLVAHVTSGRQTMDRDGRRAARGRVLSDVLAVWLEHPFLRKKPPKTTGREVFGRAFVTAEIDRLQATSRSPDDWIATATAFTARTVARACRQLPLRQPTAKPEHTAKPTRDNAGPKELIVCGGGTRNSTLVSMLSAELPGVAVRPIDAMGIPSQAKEAVSFAMLAAARLDLVPANLPQVTGARRPVILGAVYLGPK